ncbi:MAG: hypothetical protein H7X83_09070 [Verrucomicrobia bacterium]|nr:hypothetical protein [Deltaproteobacteria bacterium]
MTIINEIPDQTFHDLHAASERARVLRDELQAHNIAYYVHDAPVVSDGEYDALMRELQAPEAPFPELVSAESPTQRVGAAPVSAFGSIKHRRPIETYCGLPEVS